MLYFYKLKIFLIQQLIEYCQSIIYLSNRYINDILRINFLGITNSLSPNKALGDIGTSIGSGLSLIKEACVDLLLSYINSFYTPNESELMKEDSDEIFYIHREKDFARSYLGLALTCLKEYYYLPDKRNFAIYHDDERIFTRKKYVKLLQDEISYQMDLLKTKYKYEGQQYFFKYVRKYEKYSELDYLSLKLEYVNNEILIKKFELENMVSSDRYYKWISPNLTPSELQQKLCKYYDVPKKLGLDMEYRKNLHETYSKFICPITQSLIREPINCDVNTYERRALRKWYLKFPTMELTTPTTRKKMDTRFIKTPIDIYKKYMITNLVSEIDKLCKSDPEIIIKIDRVMELKEKLIDLQKKKKSTISSIKSELELLNFYYIYVELYPNLESIPKSVDDNNLPEKAVELFHKYRKYKESNNILDIISRDNQIINVI